MFISKIKPCMYKFNRIYEKPRTAHYNGHDLLDLDNPKWTTVEKLELIHALKLCPYGKAHLLEQNQAASAASC